MVNQYRALYLSALTSRAPKLLSSLRASDELEPMLRDVEERGPELQLELMAQMAERNPLPESYLARAKRLTADSRTAREVVMAQLTEEIPNELEPSATTASRTPMDLEREERRRRRGRTSRRSGS